MGRSELRVKLDGLLETGNGGVHVLVPQGEAEIVVEVRIVRVELDGVTEAVDRRVELFLIVEYAAKVGMNRGVLPVEVEGLLVAQDGLVELPVLVQCIANIQVSARTIRANRQGSREIPKCPRVIVLATEVVPQIDVHPIVSRVGIRGGLQNAAGRD